MVVEMDVTGGYIYRDKKKCACGSFLAFLLFNCAIFCGIGNPYLSDNSCCVVYLHSNKTVPGEKYKYFYHYNSRVEEGFCNIK